MAVACHAPGRAVLGSSPHFALLCTLETKGPQPGVHLPCSTPRAQTLDKGQLPRCQLWVCRPSQPPGSIKVSAPHTKCPISCWIVPCLENSGKALRPPPRSEILSGG